MCCVVLFFPFLLPCESLLACVNTKHVGESWERGKKGGRVIFNVYTDGPLRDEEKGREKEREKHHLTVVYGRENIFFHEMEHL